MSNIRKLFEEAVSRTPDKVFFIFKDKEITFKDFLQNVNKVASGFISLGVKKGDKIAILLPNCLEFPYCWLAANMIGAVVVPINCRLVAEEVKYIINHSEARILITSNDYMKKIEKIRRECSFVDSVINIGKGVFSHSIPFSDFLKNSTDVREVNISKEDPAVILYTSGTTGRPKGCIVGHDYFLNLGDIQGRLFQLTSEDRVFSVQPYYYVDPQWNTIMVMTYNSTLVLGEKFSPSKFWDQVRHHKITCFYCVGAMLSFLYNMPPSELDKKHDVRMVLTSGILPGIHKAWEERFNVPVYEVYASTETSCDIAVTVDLDRKVGTACIGRPVDYREAKIVDEDDFEVPNGQVGEIILKRGKGMMKGYYKDPEATSRAFRGGWFHTGDLGYKDEDSDFHFVGRKKDIIRRGGENISAASVEEVLMRHPKILDAAVIPVPDEIRGEEVKIYIVLKPNEELSPEEIVAFCFENMASFKVPRYIEFRESLPKTPSERVQKHKLREEKADLTEGCYDRLAEKIDLKPS